MVVLVLADLDRFHHRQQRLVQLAESEQEASEVERWVMNFDCPAYELLHTRLRVCFGHLGPHLVVEIPVQIVHCLLVVLGHRVHQAGQQMAHVETFVARGVSCETLNLGHLLGGRRLCHGGFNASSTLLDPLFKQERRMGVLVVGLPEDELAKRDFQLRQGFEHHLLESKVAAVEVNRNETGVQFDRGGVVHPNFKLGQQQKHFFHLLVEQFVKLVDLHFHWLPHRA